MAPPPDEPGERPVEYDLGDFVEVLLGPVAPEGEAAELEAKVKVKHPGHGHCREVDARHDDEEEVAQVHAQEGRVGGQEEDGVEGHLAAVEDGVEHHVHHEPVLPEVLALERVETGLQEALRPNKHHQHIRRYDDIVGQVEQHYDRLVVERLVLVLVVVLAVVGRHAVVDLDVRDLQSAEPHEGHHADHAREPDRHHEQLLGVQLGGASVQETELSLHIHLH
eukprot:CAMPEP_0182467680 /NCGR_PEP_ID=MMETSP1319-20130603/14362_1 /TAXON_ID=172717 /ORGANISM="Bolidomonas pacifica, Strain RCC208" /LENGTH=221 /DNA_ID=CAMNT_0024667795 /DNA_START=218 /DNA_END=882 /DNA_ORIENTATION=+